MNTENTHRQTNTIPDGCCILYRSTFDGKISENGTDAPSATVITETDTHIVVKVPGHKYWAGLYMPRGYASPETVVYEKVDVTNDGNRIVARALVAWDNSRGTGAKKGA
jgi:hypothetical protein